MGASANASGARPRARRASLVRDMVVRYGTGVLVFTWHDTGDIEMRG